MATNQETVTLNKTEVQFADGTGTPVTLTITNDTSVTVSGLAGASLQAPTHVQRRGKHFCTVQGERVYPQITIEFLHTGFVGATAVPGTPLEFAQFKGLYSANVSTRPGGTRSVKSIDIRVSHEGTDYGDTDSALTFEDCVLMSHGFTDAVPSTYSMTFEVTGDIDGDLDYIEA